MAEEALAFHMEGSVADGTAIPKPSNLEDAIAGAENRGTVAILIAAMTELLKAVWVGDRHTFDEDCKNDDSI